MLPALLPLVWPGAGGLADGSFLGQAVGEVPIGGEPPAERFRRADVDLGVCADGPARGEDLEFREVDDGLLVPGCVLLISLLPAGKPAIGVAWATEAEANAGLACWNWVFTLCTA